MSDFIIYWKYEEYMKKPPELKLALKHVPSNQLRKVKVKPNDFLWVITFKKGRMHLLGRLDVEKIVSETKKAEKILGERNLWRANYHAIAKSGTVKPMPFIDITKLASKLRFEGKADRLPSPFDGRSFETIRRLTPGSAAKLNELCRLAIHSRKRETSPPRIRKSNGQGQFVSPELRKKIEAHAMSQAKIYFKRGGYRVEDKSRDNSFDLQCSKKRDIFFVEVKGTVSRGESLILTANEVDFALKHLKHMALFVLHSVDCIKEHKKIYVRGGKCQLLKPWDIRKGTLKPIEFNYVLGGS